MFDAQHNWKNKGSSELNTLLVFTQLPPWKICSLALPQEMHRGHYNALGVLCGKG